MKEPTYFQNDCVFEVKADCYNGDSGDEIKPVLWGFCNGDMQDDTTEEPWTIDPKHLPIGTKVEIKFPHCPECDLSQEVCDCGFDWETWIKNTYG
ncbi:hypothetical protein PDESU_03322 [Pontiella desulfatans]|uniref:Uncharacterized protein n=1 Tax=Pontiella desulfatans TaxID=2750659 RepID=A0A6C2U4E1_PONDE|nr:hypothetical protein [Pontiella desulfatans]VGO14753.1 hypothetical protein PDESU_03322 [Pontiella desulfatans]